MHNIITHSKGKIFFSRNERDTHQPTIVFLHDSFGCVKLWRDFPENLARELNYNVLIYDRFGHGKSDPFPDPVRRKDYLEKEADILNDLLISLDLENVILFGHSDGASIALIAAAKYSDKISAVISEAAHVLVEEMSLEGIKRAVADYESGDLKSRLEKYHAEKTEALFRAWSDTWTSGEFSDWNMEHLLPEIKCPVMIIQGENDEYGTLKQVNAIEIGVSGKTSKLIIPNIGHTPHREVPEVVLENAARFLREES